MNRLSGKISHVLIIARRALVTFLAFAFVLPGAGGSEAAAPPSLEIRVLSSRPDMVSGGDTLIEVKAPTGTQKSQIALSLNNKDVSSSLKDQPGNGSFRALVNGLTIGDNTLSATIKSPKASANLKVTNYPITGPI